MFYNVKVVCSLWESKWNSPKKRAFQSSVLIASCTDTHPKIVIRGLAVSSAWVITALQRALATKTQTGHQPAFFTATRRAPARAFTDNLSYAKATAGSRKDPPTNSAPTTSSTKDIKPLVSMIEIIDIGEIVLLANKFKAVANPVEKILILAEHAPLVEAIKNNKI
ncbi:hypothetical protein EVAR_19552_1 [Eumeta japonica]|uniref:Uncharacterized protein n=1 Tax=Eumeta variegata TaxID=151549 RepID=A0A4C1UGF9_EUMVA|nr:hypothetical protein EVAR_19552_1 [Eumeta japonica]